MSEQLERRLRRLWERRQDRELLEAADTLKRYRDALEAIASCDSHATSDVVDLARQALAASR